MPIKHASLQGQPVRLRSDYFAIEGYQPGPATTYQIPIWMAANKPGMLRLVGKLADGWLTPLNTYMPLHEAPTRQKIIDEAATKAGRAPSDVRRILNIAGRITAHGQATGAPIDTPQTTGDWITALADLVTDYGFDSFIFWTQDSGEQQLHLYATEVIPAVRQEVARRRKATTA